MKLYIGKEDTLSFSVRAAMCGALKAKDQFALYRQALQLGMKLCSWFSMREAVEMNGADFRSAFSKMALEETQAVLSQFDLFRQLYGSELDEGGR